MRLCAADDESEDAGLQALTHKDGDAVTRTNSPKVVG